MFKVGDTVEAVQSYGRCLTKGKTYEVVEVTPVYTKVMGDTPGPQSLEFFHRRFRAADDATSFIPEDWS